MWTIARAWGWLTCHLGDDSAEVLLVHSRLPDPQLAGLRSKHAVDLVEPAHVNGSPQPFCMHELLGTPSREMEVDPLTTGSRKPPQSPPSVASTLPISQPSEGLWMG